MKKRLFVISFIVYTLLSTAFAGDSETYEFRNYIPKGQLSKIDITKIHRHYLGEDVSRKMQLIDLLYTVKTEGSSRLTYKKYSIYFSIKKLDAFFKKSVKKGFMTEQDALTKFEKCLDISLAVFTQDTAKLETALKKANNDTSILAVFNRVNLVDKTS